MVHWPDQKNLAGLQERCFCLPVYFCCHQLASMPSKQTLGLTIFRQASRLKGRMKMQSVQVATCVVYLRELRLRAQLVTISQA